MRRLIFEVDETILYDLLLEAGGDTTVTGRRLVSVFLSGKPTVAENLGLRIYGIELKKVEQI